MVLINSRWLKPVFNFYTICLLIFIALVAMNASSIQGVQNVVNINKVNIAFVNSESPPYESQGVWRESFLPSQLTALDGANNSNQWIRVVLPSMQSSYSKSFLIKNIYASQIYLNEQLIYSNDEYDNGDSSYIQPAYLSLALFSMRNEDVLYIKTHNRFLLKNVEPFVYGESGAVYKEYTKTVFWNIILPRCLQLISLLLVILLGISSYIFKGAKRNSTAFCIALSALVWLSLTTLNHVPPDLFYFWRVCVKIAKCCFFYNIILHAYYLAKIEPNKYNGRLFVLYLTAIISVLFVEQSLLFHVLKITNLIPSALLVFCICLIFKKAYKVRNWDLLSLGLVLIATLPFILHDGLMWSGLLQTLTQSFSTVGIIGYYLLSTRLSYFTLVPYLGFIVHEIMCSFIREKQAKLDLIELARKTRAKLSKDIHDSFGSTLTLAMMNIKDGTATFEGLSESIESAHMGVRHLIENVEQGFLNLPIMVKSECEELSRAAKRRGNIEVIYRINGERNKTQNVSTDTEFSLRKILHECVMNAIKHSYGTKVYVNLYLYKEHATLTVVDNGVGLSMEVDSISARGNGLSNIRARAKECGGSITFNSRPGQTMISVTAPYEQHS